MLVPHSDLADNHQPMEGSHSFDPFSVNSYYFFVNFFGLHFFLVAN